MSGPATIQLSPTKPKESEEFVNDFEPKETVMMMIQNAGPKFVTYFKDSVLFYRENPRIFKSEFLSGVTVTILQVPESVAFSYVADVPVASGLFSTFILGFVTAAIGGKPAMISGAAGAMAVVVKVLMAEDGPLEGIPKEGPGGKLDHLWMTMFLCGIFQMLAGIFQLANAVRLIPQSAMLGFMNGLAIVIFMAQFTAFQECKLYPMFTDCSIKERTWLQIDEGKTWMSLALVAITMFTMHFYPKLPKVGKWLPASLVSLIVCTALEHGVNRTVIGYNTRLVSETAVLAGTPPNFHFPATRLFSADSWATIVSYAVSLAAVGLIESVMTLQALDVITQTQPSIFKCNQECFAQGFGNFICSLFGCMGGDAMIGQSTINTLNGARGRVSGMVAGLGMFVAVIVASKVIEIIPVPSLTGILFMVVIYTFNWNTFKMLYKLRRSDAVGIVLVTGVAVWQNLAIAVGCGVVWQALVTSWDQGNVKARSFTKSNRDGELTKVYVLQNNLFFGAVNHFRTTFDYYNDPDHVIIDFRECALCDFSAVVAVAAVQEQYERLGKTCSYQRLDAKSKRRMENAGNTMSCNLRDSQVLNEAGEPVTSPLRRGSAGVLQDLEIFALPSTAAEAPEASPFDTTTPANGLKAVLVDEGKENGENGEEDQVEANVQLHLY